MPRNYRLDPYISLIAAPEITAKLDNEPDRHFYAKLDFCASWIVFVIDSMFGENAHLIIQFPDICRLGNSIVIQSISQVINVHIYL